MPGPEAVRLERLGQGRHEHDDQDGDEQPPERQHAPEVGGPASGSVRSGSMASSPRAPAVYSASGATPWPSMQRPAQQAVVAGRKRARLYMRPTSTETAPSSGSGSGACE